MIPQHGCGGSQAVTSSNLISSTSPVVSSTRRRLPTCSRRSPLVSTNIELLPKLPRLTDLKIGHYKGPTSTFLTSCLAGAQQCCAPTSSTAAGLKPAATCLAALGFH